MSGLGFLGENVEINTWLVVGVIFAIIVFVAIILKKRGNRK